MKGQAGFIFIFGLSMWMPIEKNSLWQEYKEDDFKQILKRIYKFREETGLYLEVKHKGEIFLRDDTCFLISW
jgi:hypothetical protein